jgi:hypothetical protein
MLIRLMTLATVLMLLACLMIGVTIALARTAGADELRPQPDAADVTDIYQFDNLPLPTDPDQTSLVSC